VDDSAATRAHVLDVLKALPDTEASAVESGTLALRAIKQGGYSIILCDYEMPDMSGLQVLRFVRTRHTALELPVLMLTSRDEADIKVRAFRSGANDYIGKQSAPEELLARVGTQIELLAAHRRLVEARLRTAEGQKFEAIGHLTDALSHELNTPSQYISDNLSFLQESFESLRKMVDALRDLKGPVAAEQIQQLIADADCDYVFNEIPRCVEESLQGIAQVASIVGVMRDFARRGVQDVTAQDLNEIVRGALAVTRGQMHQVADLELQLDPNLPPVQCVGAAIKQVVLYAIMNAVKAMTPEDGMQRARGRLRLRTAIETNGWATIEISDSGRGIPSDMLANVLNPVLGASQLGEAAQALAHARTVIVGDHGGKLDITSSDRDGTSIVIRLQPGGERVSRQFVAVKPDSE
jgi:signal transduction histidine kinase